MGDDDGNTADQDDQVNNSTDDSMNGSSSDVCRIYDKEDIFTIFVQILLGLFALMSLYIKRQQEVPRRTFKTWFLDVSKQGFGAVYAHVLNMVVAAVLSQNIRGETTLDDQCAWYGLSYLIDTTLGLFLSVIGLRCLDHIANERDWTHLKHSGVYTGQMALLTWTVQLTAWLFILTIVKMQILLFMWIASEVLATFGAFLFAPLQFNKRFELVFVMILFPGILNCVYFWIADSYLQAKKDAPGGAHEPESDTSGKKESLLQDMAENEIVTNIYNPASWSALAGSTRNVNTREYPEVSSI